MAEPKCSDCVALGVALIVTAPSEQTTPDGVPRLDVVYCSACGHIYGIVQRFMRVRELMPDLPNVPKASESHPNVRR